MTSTQPIAVQPPIARRQETVTTIHGHRLADDYGWLREKTNPEVIAFLEQENAYTRAVMKPTEELQARLYAEMISHIKETDVSVPFQTRIISTTRARSRVRSIPSTAASTARSTQPKRSCSI